MRKQVLAGLLSLCLVAGSMPTVALAAEPMQETDTVLTADDIALAENSETGTPDTTWWTARTEGQTEFQLSTPDQLAGLILLSNQEKKNDAASAFAGCTIYLEKDIDMSAYSGTLTGKPTDGYTFTATENYEKLQGGTIYYSNFTLDGQGHTICNFVFSSNSKYDNRTAFIAGASASGTVKDLTFENCAAISNQTASLHGIVVGQNRDTVENVQVRNCTVYVPNGTYVGGVVGRNSGTVQNCTVSDTFVSGKDVVGGISGYDVADDTSPNVNSIGNHVVNAVINNAGRYSVGGISGELNCASSAYRVTVRDCSVTNGDICTVAYDAALLFGTLNSKGTGTELTIENCTAFGSVRGTYFVGNVVGNLTVKDGWTGQYTLRDCETVRLYADEVICTPTNSGYRLTPAEGYALPGEISDADISGFSYQVNTDGTASLITDGNENASVYLKTIPLQAGYVFGGYYANSSFSDDPTDKGDRKDYYTKWIDLDHSDISLEYQGTTSISAPDGITFGWFQIENNGICSVERIDNTLVVTAHDIGTTTIYITGTYQNGDGIVTQTAFELPVTVTPAEGETEVGLLLNGESITGSDTVEQLEYTGEGTAPIYDLTGLSTAGNQIEEFTVSFYSTDENNAYEATVSGPSASLTAEAIKKIAPQELGSYSMVIIGQKDSYYAHASRQFEIVKATPVLGISADRTALTGGGTVTLTVTGLPNGASAALSCNDSAITVSENEGSFTASLPNETKRYVFTASYGGDSNHNPARDVSCTVEVTRRSSSGGGSGGSSSGSKTETVTHSDGSKTTTVTDSRTGAVTETTRYTDGSTLVVETAKGGAVTTTSTAKNGVKIQTVDQPGEDVTAQVTLPRSVGEAVVVIPADVSAGTVAVDAKTGEIVKLSVPTQDGMAVKLDGSADLILVDNAGDFDDTSRHWAEDAIDFATAHQLFSGTGAHTFSPDAPMTRAMLMTVLARFDGQEISGGAAWYDGAMAWAVSQGISDGSSPQGQITREQLATMLWRYAGSPAPSGASLSAFADADRVSGYASDALRWAVSQGLISGTDSASLAPQGDATRAQVATILMRFVENLTR